ncbi:MAG TPA: transcription termination/antitermination NusG family protein [Bryobacteraceae bacterium]|nr:transcription termination/antitermination NusG family protein [Bryobacteraceae bacterium]
MSEFTSSQGIHEQTRWYALAVRYQHEQQTARALRSKGLETLVPLYRSPRQWSDRVKEIDLPVFAGYVLCQFPLAQRTQVTDTPGVAKIVGFGGRPAPLEDSEIAGIRLVMESKQRWAPWPYLKAGDRVRVERGPLRGLEGTLLRTKDALRLVIGVELLQRSMAVELDRTVIGPVWKKAV